MTAVSNSGSDRPRAGLWERVRLLTGIVLLIGIFVFIAEHWQAFLNQLLTLNMWFVVIALAINVVNLFLSALRWQVLLRADGVQVSIWRLARYYLVSLFFNIYLPPFVGADTVRILSLRESKSAGVRVVSVLIERGSGLAALVIYGGLAIVFSSALRQYLLLDILIGVVLLAIIGAFIALLFPDLWLWAAQFTRRLPQLFVVLMDIAAAGRRYRAKPRVLLTTFAISFIIQILVVLALYVRTQALHVNVSLTQTMVVAPVITLLTLIPLTPGGIGTQEAFYALTYGAMGITQTLALGMALLARALDWTMGIAGAIIWLRER